MERATGRVELSAVANGCLDKPTLDGAGLCSGAGSVRGAPLSFRGVEGQVIFDPDALRVQALRAAERRQGGRDRRGQVEGLRAPGLPLEAELDEVAMRATPDIPFRADGA